MPKCETCPKCGANLDHGERCDDCYQNEKTECCALMIVPQPEETDPTPELTRVMEDFAPSAHMLYEEQIAAIVTAISQITNAICEIAKRIIETVAESLPSIVSFIKNIVMMEIPQKWWHYCKHGKKRRTRLKYEKRIHRQFRVLLERADI